MQSIKRLPKSVHSSLRSSIILSDLPRVVEELVYNSIDANAKKIDISVNVRACYVKVEDDGCGITRDELVLLGEKYATSKFHDVMGDVESSSRSFGSNGEALASLSDISVVEVRTKARGRPNSYCKIIKGSKCSHLGIDDQREAVGTTVVVRELFYNQPVRRKQMQSSHKRELHNVKKCVLRVALIHPQVTVRLLDIDSEDELLYTVPSSSPLALISNSFGNDVSSCLHEISTSDQSWVLSGHISGPTDVFCNKDFQYLYINSRFVSRSPIHNILNNLAASFQLSIMRTNEEMDGQSRKRQKTDVYPAYLLNFRCPRSSYDLHFEPSKTIVEFKDWQSILVFFEQTIANYWKKQVPQPSKGKAIDVTLPVGAPLKSNVKSNKGLLKHQHVQNKEDDADLQQRILQKSAVRESNVGTGAAAAPRDSQCFSFDLKPSAWHLFSPDRISGASEHADSIARNDRIHFPERASYQWFDNGSCELEDSDHSGANPTVWKKRRMEGIFHGHAYSCNFGKFDDVQTKGLSADDQESEIMGLDIDLQEPCFGGVNRPNSITCDFMQNETNIKSNMSSCDGFYDDFDELNEDHLLNEVTETIADISCPEMSHFSDGFYHEDRNTSSILKRCSTRKKLGTIAGYVEGLETNVIPQMNFPDTHPVWESDDMDRSSIKDDYLNFSDPYMLADTPRGHSHARTGLESQGRSISFAYGNFENVDSDFRFTLDRFNSESPRICEGPKKLDRFNSESPRICEGPKKLNNFNDQTQSPNYFSSVDRFVDQFVSKDDELAWKSKTDATLSYNISPERSTTGCQLKVSSSNMANNSVLAEDLLNQHDFGFGRRSRLTKVRSRSCSAPPFYKGKRKFPGLNQPQFKLAAEDDRDIPMKESEDTAPAPEDISPMSATQPIPETSSSEFSGLTLSLKGNVKMCEEACSDGFENFTAQISKWRDDSDQHTALELPHVSSECYDDVLSISSGPLNLSCSSLVPECIDKNCFEEARVLLQLDKKFIPVISGKLLLLVDQHAADERIRLEELRSKVLSDEDRGITYLDSEEDMALPETGYQLFQKYSEQIQKWGWIINNSSISSQSFKKNMNILRRQARAVTLAAVPSILGVDLTGKDLMDFIQQLDETDGSSGIPPAVLRILNFKACRGAIMFGDPLLPSECCLIIEELKATSLCFQCAHGRPTTVPVVNVASLHDELARLGMMSGRSEAEEPWHGLSHHGPSLERAQTRLKQLRRLRQGCL
ncbi:DNA mismatch repair protein MLH3-like [Lolium rigidum]|uniref:DNA mismatch repair protein MLH3-like n=1 Tax=Lolium rigidum TaxID=89674 RepID=UPI001F5E2A3F|nr:DNA mismatch repair protein MLH3-like [Lolium rigidum]